MVNLTTQVQNLLTRHDIDLLRVDASLGKDIDGILNGLSKKLRDRIIRSDIINAKPVILNKKLNQLVMVGASDIAKAYEQLTDTVVGELSDLAVLEEATARDTINRAVRVDIASNQVHLAKLKALAGNTMIEGAPIKEWWAKQPKAIAEGFKNHIRAGMLAGEDIEAMTRRIHGSRALKYKDGLIRGPARHAAKRLVRSSVLAVANDARRLSYEANSHVIKGIQWVSTLDNRTSDLCKALDGQSWTLKGDRMRGTVVKFPGYPPAHWNCRSTTIPITKTFTELARENKGNVKKKLTGLSKSTKNKTRASMDGKVASKMNYEEWLAKQPVSMQKEVLGQTKYDLWKAKKISFTDLVDQSGNPRTVAQLKALFDKTKFVPPVIKPSNVKPKAVEQTSRPLKQSDVIRTDYEQNIGGEKVFVRDMNTYIVKGERAINEGLDLPEALKAKVIAEGTKHRKLLSAEYAKVAKIEDKADKLVESIDDIKPKGSLSLDDLKVLLNDSETAIFKDQKKVVAAMKDFRTKLLRNPQMMSRRMKFNDWFDELNLSPTVKRGSTFKYKKEDGVLKKYKVKLLDVVRGAIGEIYQMSGIQAKHLTSILKKGNRGSASRYSGKLNIGGGRRATIFHEYGHFVEYNSTSVHKAAIQFLSKRRFSQNTVPIRRMQPQYGYAADEKCFVGDFLDPYVAKDYRRGIYDGSPSTEIISMGLEHFHSAEAMAELYIRDNELFSMIVGVLTG